MIDVINGQSGDTPGGTAVAALSDFYRAFNNRDIQGIAKIWINTEAASMSNPLGGLKRGWQEIKTVYEKIFNGPAEVFVEFYDFRIDECESMFCAAGRERGWLQINRQCIDLAIRTSRIYQMKNGLWHQLHHHGSIDNPDLLKNYQQAVLNQIMINN